MVFIAVLTAIIWIAPVQAAAPQQQTDNTTQVYALPGILRVATNQSFSTYLVASDGALYGLSGETPAVEDRIDEYRDTKADNVVKVWGTLYPNGLSSKVAEIVVKSIQPAQSAEATATQVVVDNTSPTVIVRYQAVNVRSGPGLAYAVIGERTIGDVCSVSGSNSDKSWWQIHCPDGLIGWIANEVVRETGDTSKVPVVEAPPPPPATATPTPAPVNPPAPPANYVWTATYYNNTNLSGNAVLSRGEPRGSHYPLDYNWGSGSPAPGTVNSNNFSARWVGSFYFDPGNYTFQVNVQDGARLYIDGIQVINAWSDGYKETSNVFLGIGSGNHQITVEFYDRTGNAQIRAWWWLSGGVQPTPAPNPYGRPRDS